MKSNYYDLSLVTTTDFQRRKAVFNLPDTCSPFLEDCAKHIEKLSMHAAKRALADDVIRIMDYIVDQRCRNNTTIITFSSVAFNDHAIRFLLSLVSVFARRESDRILVVDANIKSNGFTSQLGRAGTGQGLIDVLSRKSDLSAAMRRRCDSIVSVMPRGRKLRASDKLITDENVDSFLNQCKKAFKNIFILAPPATQFKDAAPWARNSDGLFLVADVRNSLQVQTLKRRYAERRINLLGAIRKKRASSIPFCGWEAFVQ